MVIVRHVISGKMCSRLDLFVIFLGMLFAYLFKNSNYRSLDGNFGEVKGILD